MKKILLLGGSIQQIPAIEYAKKAGYHTVLCDYLEDNPGQYVADKFYLVSTTDKKAVLEVAKKENVDGIVAYASDPAAITAAYVANKLELPSNPYESVEILSKKNLFRKFLRENNFNCPESKEFNSLSVVWSEIDKFKFPIMIKPIDSSGSKGVSKVNSIEEIENAFNYAMNMSREKTVIIEEYIERDHDFMIGGDTFVIDGKIEFWGLLNCHRDNNGNDLVPVGKSYPLMLQENRKDIIYKELQKLMDILKIKFGAFNVEMMFNNNKLYFIEVGPRNGGNMIPNLLNMATGVDTIESTVECALGNFNVCLSNSKSDVFYSTYILHANKDGFLKNINYSDEIKKTIVKTVMYKKSGDEVLSFDGANKALGIIFMKHKSSQLMTNIMDNIDEHIKIELI